MSTRKDTRLSVDVALLLCKDYEVIRLTAIIYLCDEILSITIRILIVEDIGML